MGILLQRDPAVPDPAAPYPTVLFIDGHSGSGKTVLAERIADESGAALLRLDDLYPGWGGLAAGSRAVAEVLHRGNYRRHDWSTGGAGELVDVDPARPMVIEGCGSLTASNLQAAREFARSFVKSTASDRPGTVWSIWLECPETLRRERALGRESDGGGTAFAPHWDEWAAQEATHFAEAQPIALAHEIRHSGSDR